jgi:phosphoribosylformimino-5-aminoimidazole carboxamide ribotide isomerase
MIEIIPAIDIIDGKCVRLSQGDYGAKKIYNNDPLEVARSFEDSGFRRLHLVDLDGAKASHIVNHKVLEKIATHTNLVIDFGGGLKTDKDLEIAFNSGAEMITGGSIAVKNEEIFTGWIDKFGAERIILGADAKDQYIAVSGWTEATDIKLADFVRKYREKGIKKIICTDISRDGMLEGPAVNLYSELLSEFPGLYLIASGGVSSFTDIHNLADNKVPAVITGKAIYENRISLKEISDFMAENK